MNSEEQRYLDESGKEAEIRRNFARLGYEL